MKDEGAPWLYWPVIIVASLAGGFASGFVWDLLRSGFCQ